jgi:hypothetical protein
MAVPAPVITVDPDEVTLTDFSPEATVVLTDTGTHNPVATGRVFFADATEVGETVGDDAGDDSVSIAVAYAADTYDMTVETTNSEDSTTSAAVVLTVVDEVETPTVARKVQTDVPGQTRIHPNYLPLEYQDPTLATPGLPTAQRLSNARRYGSILTD